MSKTTNIASAKWDKRFLDLAYYISGWSKDPSTQCGAIIVRPDRTICSTGYNGFPRGMPESLEMYENKDIKYPRVVHSEMNAILTAPEPVTGYTLYNMPIAPCARCASHIVQSGIKRVVFRKPHLTDQWELDRWTRTNCPLAVEIMRDCGIEIVQISGNW